MRTIDADEFFRNYSELAIEPYINAQTVEVIPLEIHEKAMNIAIDDFFKVQEELERVRNEKRPQGEWKFNKEMSITCSLWNCSVCNRLNGNDSFIFCPNCGAEMKPKTCTNCETFGKDCGDCEVGDDD